MLQLENDKLRQRIKALQDTIETLKARNSQILADATIFSVVGSDGKKILKFFFFFALKIWTSHETSLNKVQKI